MTDRATEKQIEYVRILSSYPDTKDKDAEAIRLFLAQHKKDKVEDLTKKEASALIEILLKLPIKYVFPCGTGKQVNKSDYNRYNLFGELEACLHECEVDVHSCRHWKKE